MGLEKLLRLRLQLQGVQPAPPRQSSASMAANGLCGNSPPLSLTTPVLSH